MRPKSNLKLSLLPTTQTSDIKKMLNQICCSVSSSCSTLRNPMNCGIPGSPVLHYLLEFAQINVHWVSDAIQPSIPIAPFSSYSQSFPESGSKMLKKERKVCCFHTRQYKSLLLVLPFSFVFQVIMLSQFSSCLTTYSFSLFAGFSFLVSTSKCWATIRVPTTAHFSSLPAPTS